MYQYAGVGDRVVRRTELFNFGWVSVRTILHDSLRKLLTIAKSSDAQTGNIK
jgi:hypothetical protein